MNNNAYTIAHSPDADDIFMYYAIKFGWVSPPYPFENLALDIETLNKGALEAKFDICAISFAVYPLILENYALLKTGMSFGEGYGPKIIKKKNKIIKKKNYKVAISGENTTNAMIFKLRFKDAKIIYKNFLEIEQAVLNDEVDMGVLIHESILNFDDQLEVYAHIWDIWQDLQSQDLPLPLGGMAIRRSIPLNKALDIEDTLSDAIKIALKHKGLLSNMLINQNLVRIGSRDLDTYLNLYANDHSHTMSELQIKALNVLFELGAKNGFYKNKIDINDYFIPREYKTLRHS